VTTADRFRAEKLFLPGPAKGYQISQYELPIVKGGRNPHCDEERRETFA